MSFEIVMPAVSPTMEKGNLVRWLARPGDTVQAGQVIVEIEADKTSVEIEAEQSGVLSEQCVSAGTSDVPVGSVLGRLAPPGTVVKQAPAEAEPVARAANTAPSIRAEAQPAKPGPDVVRSSGNGSHDRAAIATANAGALATPIARRLALQLGIELGSIDGSGRGGRITRADLEAYSPVLRVAPAPTGGVATPADLPLAPPPEGVPHRVETLSGMRKTIARRLGESKRTIPHFYMSVDARCDALLKLRAECNARPGATKLSLNDFVIRACAHALTKVPEANAQYAGDQLYRFERVDISVAVAVDDGLFTPVIRDAANKGVSTIAEQMQGLAARARDGQLSPEEYAGGTFSISNLGMYGVKQFEAVINPPQAAILAVGAVQPRAWPDGEELIVAKATTLTLSCDHRVIDGAVGARLLDAIRAGIEDPLGLLLG